LKEETRTRNETSPELATGKQVAASQNIYRAWNGD
jgi:hypothetical protein